MLSLTLISIAAGIIAGFLVRGSLGNLRSVRFAAGWLLPTSVLVGIVIPLFLDPPKGLTRTLVAISYLGVLAVLIMNLRTPRMRAGMAILALGWALNVLPMVANGGMPMSLWAHDEAGITEVPTPGEQGFFKIVIAGPGTRLRQLGDVIPIRALRQVVSLGDLFLMAGVAVAIAQGMRSERTVPAQAG